jgi:hypothetical protein
MVSEDSTSRVIVLPVRLISLGRKVSITIRDQVRTGARLYEDLHFPGSFSLSNEQAVESSTKARAVVVVVVATCKMKG